MATNIYASKEGTLSNALKKTIITFTNTKTPTVPNYNLLYSALHGQYPIVMLMRLEGTDYVEQKEQPYRTMVGGLLSKITWDFPDEITGYIVLI